MKVTMQEVANKAEVSTATVSRVLRNFPGVREKTKKRVLKVISELNYEVNAVARSLAARRTKIIGLIVSDLLAQFNAVVTKSIEEVARRYDYSVIICNNDENPEKELRNLKVLESNRVDGIILMSTCRNIEYVNWMISSGRKIVLIDRLIKGVICDAVLVDNEGGAYKITKFLIDQGYRRIATIAGIQESTTGIDRLKGYLRALRESDIRVDKDFIKYGDFMVKSGGRLSKELFDLPKKPDAIFAANLQMLRGLLITLNKKKISIPKDIGVVTFDDIEWPDILIPSITAIKQPVHSIGNMAAELLFKKIEKETEIEIENPTIITLNTILKIRNSTKKQ